MPPLLRDGALVALVAASEDATWVAEAAWSVARAAAAGSQGKRRAVALVDLCLDAPLLHMPKHLPLTPGIADAFASDAALNEVARDVDGVYFLAAGASPGDPADVYGAARWRRLQAGFRSEGALMLVCLPSARLAELGAEPDGVVALSPGGVDLGSVAGRALLAAREAGIELLGVVRERWSAPSPAGIGPRPPRTVRSGVLAFAAVAAIVGTVLLTSHSGSQPRRSAAARPAAGRESFGTAQAALSIDSLPSRAPSLPVLAQADSGGWTLQLGAYGATERAQSHLERLVAAGLPAFISPLAPDASGTVWYRVLAGAYPSRDSAVAARRDLWRRGIAGRGEGTPLFAPYSLVLAHSSDAGRLQAAGLAGVRWGERSAVLVGAFERPEQASVAAAQLQRNGIATTLVTRTDRTP